MKEKKRGVSLIWALVMCTVLLTIGSTIATFIIKDSTISFRNEESTQAQAAAQSGIAWAKYFLSTECQLSLANNFVPSRDLVHDGDDHEYTKTKSLNPIGDSMVNITIKVPDNITLPTCPDRLQESDITVTSVATSNGVTQKIEYKPSSEILTGISNQVAADVGTRLDSTSDGNFSLVYYLSKNDQPGVYSFGIDNGLTGRNNKQIKILVDATGAMSMKLITETEQAATWIPADLPSLKRINGYKVTLKYTKGIGFMLTVQKPDYKNGFIPNDPLCSSIFLPFTDDFVVQNGKFISDSVSTPPLTVSDDGTIKYVAFVGSSITTEYYMNGLEISGLSAPIKVHIDHLGSGGGGYHLEVDGVPVPGTECGDVCYAANPGGLDFFLDGSSRHKSFTINATENDVSKNDTDETLLHSLEQDVTASVKFTRIRSSINVGFTGDGNTGSGGIAITGFGSRVCTKINSVVNCSRMLQDGYPTTGTITLSATTAPDSVFIKWDGCDSTAGNICILSGATDENVTVTILKTVVVYQLDDRSGLSALDSSGNGHNATLGSSTGWIGASDSRCRKSTKGCLYLNGTSNFMDLGFGMNSQSFTIEMWVKPNATQNTNANLIDDNHDSTHNWSLEQYNAANYNFGMPGANNSVTGVNIDSSQWHHLVLVRDQSSGTQVYKGGSPAYSNTGTATVTFDSLIHLIIGGWGGHSSTPVTSPNPTRRWAGYLDYVRIYNQALSADQVHGLYQSWQ